MAHAYKIADPPRLKLAQIELDRELADLLPRPARVEGEALVRQLFADGCSEPLIVWNFNGRRILLIGYRLFPALKKHGQLTFPVIEKTFPDRGKARAFVIDYALGNRMLTPPALSYYRAQRFRAARPKWGGDRKGRRYRAAKNKGLRVKALAELYGVSVQTLYRDGEFADAVDALEATLQAARRRPIKTLLFAGDSRATRRRVLALAGQLAAEQLRVLIELRRTGKWPRQQRTGPPATMTLPVPLDEFSPAFLRRLGPADACRYARQVLADATAAGTPEMAG